MNSVPREAAAGGQRRRGEAWQGGSGAAFEGALTASSGVTARVEPGGGGAGCDLFVAGSAAGGCAGRETWRGAKSRATQYEQWDSGGAAEGYGRARRGRALCACETGGAW